ncbi:MAG: glycosyltransferase family 39 protein, partial [Acidobacteria bacterium]|nr:glycosyltransferase family 39 protein [Acidobacteriota bacterium]
MEQELATDRNRPRRPPYLGGGALAVWLALAGCWIGFILSQAALPRSLGRALLPLALLLTTGWLAKWAFSAIRRGPAPRRILLGLLAIALAVRLAGVDHEVEERAYLDEGTYYHHATKINEGEVLRFSFVYPHLLYYLDAFTLWNTTLFPGAWDRLCRTVFEVSETLGQSWVALRLLAALLSVLAVGAVFQVGRRFAGTAAGALGAALLVFSPLTNDGAHLIISDVPSASLAAVSWMFAAGLLLEQRRRDYILAGVFAGLAAATKYPAGVVAVAIIAAWIRGRLADRRWSYDLVLAGSVSLGSFLLVMPTFFLHPRLAVFGDRGMLFGFRQYSGGGWIGVMPENIPAYYGAELAGSFGLPALLLGVAGLVFLVVVPGLRKEAKRESGASTPALDRRTLLWLMVFPVIYLSLIASMNMVVRRNLYPALPPLAALLGIGLGHLLQRLAPKSLPWRRALTAALVLLALTLPVRATLLQTVSLTRPSTREAAAAWIREHLPPGSAILKESYTPRLDPARHALWQQRFVGRMTLEQIRNPSQDFLLLAKPAYGRFLQDEELKEAHHFEISRRYQEIFDSFEKLAEFAPSATRRGPWLELYRIANLQAPPVSSRTFTAAEAFVPDGAMRPKKTKAVRFTAPGQWVAFKGTFDPGPYRLAPEGTFSIAPRIEIRDLDNQVLVSDLSEPYETRIPTADKLLVYLYAHPDDRLTGLAVEAP